MALPPGAHVVKSPYPFGGGLGAAGLMGPPAVAVPPGFRGKGPPAQMLMMAGNQQTLMPPPSLLAAGGGYSLATSPPLSRTTSPGTMTAQPGPPGRSPIGPPHSFPQFAFVNGKQIMMPPGMKSLMGGPGPSQAPGATAAAAPPQAVMHSKMMMPPGQGWETRRGPSPTTSPPLGAMSRGAAAASTGGGGSPSPLRVNPGQGTVRPPMQATALPSPPPSQPQPTRVATTGAAGSKSRQFNLVRRLTNALSSLKPGSASDRERENEQLRPKVAAVQQRVQTPPGLDARAKDVGGGPAGPHSSSTWMPRNRSLPHPAGQSPPRTQQPMPPPQLMSNAKMMVGQPPASPRGKSPTPMSPAKSGNASGGAGAAAAAAAAAPASSPMRMPPGQLMAIKGRPGRGGVVGGATNAIMGPPPPGAGHSMAATPPPAVRLVSSPQQQLQHPSPAGSRLVKCIVGPPPPHERLIPAPLPKQPQQQSHSRSTSPPTASLPSPPLPATPPPAATAAANALRVPSSTVLKEDQLPEAGVRSPGHRLRRLGESSEDSDSNGGDGGGGAHAGTQVAVASHSHGPGHLRDPSLVKDTGGAVGSGTAQKNAAEEGDAALHEEDKTQPPRPSSSSPPRHAAARETRDHSHHPGDGDCNDGTHHTTGAMTSKSASAGAGAAAMSQSSSSAHRDSNNKTSASTIRRPVRQTSTTAARSAAAAAKRRQEEEERRRHEAAGKDVLASKKLRSSRSKSAPCAKHSSPPQPAAAAGVAREPPSPQEEDNTQKPSSVERSIHSIASTASCRAPLSPSGSSTSTLSDKKSPRTPTRGRGRAVGGGGGGDGFAAQPGSASTRSGKRPGKAAHFDPSDTQKNGQWQRQPRSIRSKPRSRSPNARRSTSRARSGNDDGDSSDADDEEDAESGSEKLTSRDLYRLAKLLRDGNADLVEADIDDRQRSGRRRRSRHRGDNRSDRFSDADSSDAGSWGRQRRGRQRRQHTTAKRRSALPLTTVGIPWRYAGTRRSLEPFASPPRVRRPLGYINVGGGRYARVGGSPYTRSQSQPRAASVGTVPLDTTNTRTLVSDAAAYGSHSPLSGERNRWTSALLDAFRNAAVAEVQRSALLDSQPASSARSGGADGGAAALYYSSQQRQRFGTRGSPPHPHTRDGCSAPGGGLDDTMSSAAESQHPYCVSTSALLSAMSSTAPLRRGTAPAYEPNEQERGRSSPPSGPLRWAAVQPYSLPSQPQPPTSAAAVTEPDGLLRLGKDKVDPAVEPNTHGTVAAAVDGAAAPVRVASWRWSSFPGQLHSLLPTTSSSVDATRAAAAATRSRSVTSNRRSSISGADTASVSAAAPTSSSLIPTFTSPTLLAPPCEQAWSRGIGNHLRTPSPSTQKRWQQEQRHAQRSESCNAANNSRTCNNAAAAAAAHAGRHTSDANLDACGSPARKEEPVYLSKATVARLSAPRQRRGCLGASAATAISPISRRSHGGVDGISSVTAQTCSKWLDEIIDSTTVTATCVRAGGGASGGGEHAVAAANAIPVVDLRREFKPRIADSGTDGRGGPSSVRAASPSLHNGGTTDYTQEFTGSRARPHVPGISFKYMIGARSATGSPPRGGGKASATGGGAVNVKTVKGISDGLPFSAYSSIRIHDPARKSPWALAPEREGLKVLPGQPALSRRRRIPVDGHAAAENGAADSELGVHEANDARHRARGTTRTVVEEVHLDEHHRPYLIVRPVPSSEEGEAQRVAVERLSRPKSIYRRANDHV
ncbi:conserved hypothetical protein [Leishmania major strain Friedlin]|uniref:Uncharacterized protein n=1 Tax=Leishmania major TaxID=5664 RepID=Q4QJD2_LEIMA|nr:conserved hypothetical protein [Leishmania major strain Friedlin]CAG9568250.1 hypothetical_protein_-_conserved [Leishmania major strain Friedlin]CAJ01990.1 conserved hypothetical protein [Leishmania major strain Friedlin]|eukprot:XP_001687547.1 conserved hypothetical protein [Leishmania major strain Friedlin]